MKWLFISSDEKTLEHLKKNVCGIFPESESLIFNAKTYTVQDIIDVLQSVTNCIMMAGEQNFVVSFIVGFLLGKRFPVYSVHNGFTKDYGVSPDEIHFLTNFDSDAELFDFLKNNTEEIRNEEKKRTSHTYLFSHGIPFTVDSFVKYLTLEDTEICQHYLNADLDVNSRDNRGTPLLNVACRNESVKMVNWLLERGAEIDVVSEDRGYTPLMDAVFKGNAEIAKILIEKGADVNKVNKEGQTMIVLAVGADKLELCKLLTENGADVDVPDAMGMSAYGYAELFKKTEILKVLEKNHISD